jgi:DNA-binding NtrC family response regulator
MANDPTTGARILIVDDETVFAAAMATHLIRDNHDCKVSHTLTEARAHLEPASPWDPDVVLLDMRLPDGSGLDLLDELASAEPKRAIVVITAFGAIDDAVAAMKRGAIDYLRKPLDLEELSLVVERVVSTRALEARLDYARERDAYAVEGAKLLGRSPAMVEVRREIAAVAALSGERNAPAPSVMIVGETGTGKDVAARMIHLSSGHPRRPFVRVDCAALSAADIEFELFGRDGEDPAPGLIETAENGTVLLDEVCELPADIQAKLLSVIERGRVRRAGGAAEFTASARFIATTNRDPETMITDGVLRSDLYFRLNVLSIKMPPLRDRENDAALLAQDFTESTARRYGKPVPTLTEAARTAIEKYRWPGNVRELEHLIERAVLLGRKGRVGPRDLALSEAAVSSSPSGGTNTPIDGMTLDAAERWLMENALERSRGNVSAAAKSLGVTRMAMRYRMEKHGL